MSDTLLSYLPVFFFTLFALALGIGLVALSTFFGRPARGAPRTDLSPYECGLPPADPGHKRFTVRFYLVAMLFILFDLEAAFLFPWAVVYRELGWFGFFEMALFLGVLGVGLAYVWMRGALDWKEAPVRNTGGAG